jgi:hypothetical protein
MIINEKEFTSRYIQYEVLIKIHALKEIVQNVFSSSEYIFSDTTPTSPHLPGLLPKIVVYMAENRFCI